MKRIEDIKEFKDIDSYYEISKIVEEVFEDRVEAHKHLVAANKEIERLNNIINEYERWLKAHLDDEFYWFKMYDKLQELKGSDKE